MFSYQHRYHAGGMADVHKHLTLIALLQSFHHKATPFAVLDAHAGEGVYDLECDESQKTKEYQTGFWPLLKQANWQSDLISHYLAQIKNMNLEKNIRYYPGSTKLIEAHLRPQDRAMFIEKHPHAISQLRQHFKTHKNIHIHERDSYEAIKALIPFQEKRGLLLLDPSYEVKAEYQALPKLIRDVHKKFSNAVIALWYPILNQGYHLDMLHQLNTLGFPKVWQHEWLPRMPLNQIMLGSGMWVLNLPWQVDDRVSQAMSEIETVLL